MGKVKDYRISVLALTVLLVAGMPQALSAAGFIKIGDIQGSSLDIRHSGWSDVISVSNPVSRSVTTATGTSRTHSEITVTKVYDKASPLLMTAVSTGQQMDEVSIEFYSPDGSSIIKVYTLKKVTVTSVRPGVDPKTGAKIETVTLLAEELK
jgi:type VI secretion system Hcp family effector